MTLVASDAFPRLSRTSTDRRARQPAASLHRDDINLPALLRRQARSPDGSGVRYPDALTRREPAAALLNELSTRSLSYQLGAHWERRRFFGGSTIVCECEREAPLRLRRFDSGDWRIAHLVSRRGFGFGSTTSGRRAPA